MFFFLPSSATKASSDFTEGSRETLSLPFTRALESEREGERETRDSVFRPLACERSTQNGDSEGERETGERRMGKGGEARKEKEEEGEEKKERGREMAM